MEPLWPEQFNLDPNHCRDVLEGAYDLPITPMVILDIGANVGAFARWASQRWPETKIHCYEPHPFNFSLLKMTEKHYGLPNLTLHEAGVYTKNETATLFENGFNCGEWSLLKFDPNGKKEEQVKLIDALDLPTCDFIKIDTEGVEPVILKRLVDGERLKDVLGVVLEYHSAEHIAVIIYLLQQAGLRLYHLAPHAVHRGILKFTR